MAQTEPHSGWTENPSLPPLTPSGLAALGKKSMEEFAKAQSDLWTTMQDAQRHWFDRMRSEAKLASEFAHKVTNCRSIPDAVAACQEWTGRRFEMMVDDSKHLLTDSQKVMERGARFLSDGLFANGHVGESLGSEDKSNVEQVRE
jgi:Phasin protein